MTFVSATPTLNVGQAVSLTPPAPAAALQFGAVLLQNLSGYQLAVSVGGDSYVLPPYMADLFDLNPATAAQVAILPSNPQSSPTTLPAYVTATWYGTTELPDRSSYPATIPAPAFAVGVAVAQQLLANGVPSVLTNTTVVADKSINVGATDLYDVSGYASVVITGPTAVPSNFGPLLYSFRDQGGRILDRDAVLLDVNGPPYVTLPVRLAVVGTTLAIVNPSTNLGPLTYTIIGSNRAALYRYDARSMSASWGTRFSGTAAASGSDSQLLAPVGINFDRQPQGPVTAWFAVGGTTQTGWFFLQDNSQQSAAQLILADTGEMVTGAGGNERIVIKPLVLPPLSASNGIWFHSTSAGAAAVSVQIGPSSGW